MRRAVNYAQYLHYACVLRACFAICAGLDDACIVLCIMHASVSIMLAQGFIMHAQGRMMRGQGSTVSAQGCSTHAQGS